MPRSFQLQFISAVVLILIFVGQYYDIPSILNLCMVLTGLYVYFYRDVFNQQEIVGLDEPEAERRTKFNRLAIPILAAIFIFAGIYFAIFGDFTFTIWPKQ